MNDVPKIIEDAAGISFDDSSHHHFHRKPQWNHSPSRQKQVFRSPRPSSRSRRWSTHSAPSKKGTNKVHLLSKRQTLNNKEVLNSHIWNNNDLVQALALGNGSSSSGWYKKQFQGATLEEVQHALKLSKHFQHNTCCTVLPAEKDAERFEKLHRERQLINIILDIVLDDSVQNKKLHSPNDLVILLVTFLLPINRLKSKLKSKLLLRSNSKRTEQQQHFDRTHVYKLVVAHQFGKEHPNVIYATGNYGLLLVSEYGNLIEQVEVGKNLLNEVLIKIEASNEIWKFEHRSREIHPWVKKFTLF